MAQPYGRLLKNFTVDFELTRNQQFSNPETYARMWGDRKAAAENWEPSFNPPHMPPAGHPSLAMTENFQYHPATFSLGPGHHPAHSGALENDCFDSTIDAREAWLFTMGDCADTPKEPNDVEFGQIKYVLLGEWTNSMGVENLETFSSTELYNFFKKSARDARAQAREKVVSTLKGKAKAC